MSFYFQLLYSFKLLFTPRTNLKTALKNKMEPIDMLYKFLESEEFEENENLDAKTNEKIKEKLEFRNTVKENLVNSFNTLDCYYVPVPVSDGTCGLTYEDALQSLETLKYESLREPFKLAMNSLISKIKKKCQIKRIGNQLMNGPLFVRFIKKIVESINAKKMIFLHNTVHLALTQICNDVLEEVDGIYENKMKSLFNAKKPIKSSLLNEQENDITNSCLNYIKEKLSMYQKTINIKDTEEKFLSKKQQIKEKFVAENQKSIEEFNNKIAKNIWNEELLAKYMANNGEIIKFSSREHFEKVIEKIKDNIRMELFECDNFASFWYEFKKENGFNGIELNVENHFKKIKEMEEKKAAEAAAAEAKRKENVCMSTPEKSNPFSIFYEPLTPISPRDFTRDTSPVSPASPVSSLRPSPPATTIHLRKDGHADMRYKENRKHLISETGVHLRVNGEPDMRFRENRTHLVSNVSIPLTKSGRPDMRFSINKKLFG